MMTHTNDKKKFWKEHDRSIDQHSQTGEHYVLSHDMYRGMPKWFNQFYAYFQVRAIKKILQNISLGEHNLGLDVGCGTGRWSSMLSNLGCKMVGVDVGYNALRYAANYQPNTEFCQGALPQLGFESSSFDFCISVMVLQHLSYSEQEKAIQDLHRILRDNGFLIVCEITDRNDPAPHVYSRNQTQWHNAFETAGFRVEMFLSSEYLPYVKLFQFLRGKLKAGHNGDDSMIVLDVGGVASLLNRSHLLSGILKGIIYSSYPLEYIASLLLPDRWARQGYFLLQKE